MLIRLKVQHEPEVSLWYIYLGLESKICESSSGPQSKRICLSFQKGFRRRSRVPPRLRAFVDTRSYRTLRPQGSQIDSVARVFYVSGGPVKDANRHSAALISTRLARGNERPSRGGPQKMPNQKDAQKLAPKSIELWRVGVFLALRHRIP